jgi:3-mercaptopyruvate sulfurtransferase SseA
MLPPVEQFEQQVGELGITETNPLVLYDISGIFVASARVWWTFRVCKCEMKEISSHLPDLNPDV